MNLLHYSNDKKWLKEHIKASLFSSVIVLVSLPLLAVLNQDIAVIIILELTLVGISALYNYYINNHDYTPQKSVYMGALMVILNVFYLLFLVLFYGEKVLREDIPKKVKSK
ncbi:hypothetical protein GLT90_01310 [Nanohaloarchaea archaeon H12]|nr:hypothetical protein [Nanohaloarchaea archaeon H12]